MKIKALFAKDKAWAEMKNLFKDMALDKQKKKMDAIGESIVNMGV